jgi:hypothetical protein
MKHSIFKIILLLTVLFSISKRAASQTLYALKKTGIDITTPFDVVTINPFTGTSSFFMSTDSLSNSAAGATAYDQQNRRYICWGYNIVGDQQLFVMNFDSLTTTNLPFSAVQPVEIEYDLQTQNTYGLWWDGSAEHFGEIDLTTGLVTSIATLPGVTAVAIGNSTFDSNTGTFIFMGLDGNNYRLYSVNAATGAILSSPIIWINNEQIRGFEFNNNNNKLYGLYTDVDSSNFTTIPVMTYYKNLRLAEIDLTTGAHTVLNPMAAVASGFFAGYQLGGLCFDQQTESYIVRVQGDSGVFLQMVDVTNGNITSSASLGTTNIFYELQVDNYDFARTFYNLPLAVESNESNLLNIKVYPNPTSDYLVIETAESIEDIVIYSLNGQVVKHLTTINTNQLLVDDLPKGSYVFTAKAESGIISSKFVRL